MVRDWRGYIGSWSGCIRSLLEEAEREMNRDSMVDEAIEASKHAQHNLRWLRSNPDKIDPSKRQNMEDYLNNLIRMAEVEKKNARRAGRTSLRNRLGNLVASIIAHSVGTRKGERHS